MQNWVVSIRFLPNFEFCLLKSLYLFSSDIERDAAFPDGLPPHESFGITGVGLVDAAIGTARLVDQHAPGSVVFIGTCGAYRGSQLVTGDLVVASDVGLGSGDVASGQMRIPALLSSWMRTDRALSELLLARVRAAGMGVQLASVCCTLGITESDELAERLNEYNRCAVENLEAFALLRAAPDPPVGIVLGVTNFVGAGGGSDWKANYRWVMRKLVQAVMGES